MRCDDLPEDWAAIPLTDPAHISDVLDLFVKDEARQAGALFLLVCDEKRRPLQPIQLDGIPRRPRAAALPIIDSIAATIGELPGLSVLCAIARSTELRVTADDLAWRRFLNDAFHGQADVLGLHVVTPAGVIPVPPVGSPA